MLIVESQADRWIRMRFVGLFKPSDSMQLKAAAGLAFSCTCRGVAHAAYEIFGIFINVSDKAATALLARVHGQHVAVHEFHQAPGPCHGQKLFKL